MDYTSKSLTEQAEDIEKNYITPVELLEQFLENIHRSKNSKRIFSEVFTKDSRREAQDSMRRQKAGMRKSFLDGIPINWKDLFDVQGKKCEGGSQLLRGRKSDKDSDLVKLAKQKGLILLGKTHLSELAFSGLGINPKTETPPNSYNSNLAPGGSSSGAAVATALNFCSAGIGSDTGGSVRIPAAWNNLVGFKPTHGILSLNGALNLCPNFDTAGPIAKTVQDCAHLFSALGSNIFGELPKDELTGKKFLVDTFLLTNDLDQTVRKSFEEALRQLTSLRAYVELEDIPEIRDSKNLAPELFPYEAYSTWRAIIEENPEKMFPPILERFRGGQKTSHKVYKLTWEKLRSLRENFNEKLKNYDFLVGPTCPILPPRVDDVLDGKNDFARLNLLSLRNTRVANLLGLTSITIPTNYNGCGFMLFAKPYEEKKLLAVAKALETYIQN